VAAPYFTTFTRFTDATAQVLCAAHQNCAKSALFLSGRIAVQFQVFSTSLSTPASTKQVAINLSSSLYQALLFLAQYFKFLQSSFLFTVSIGSHALVLLSCRN
jgi:hypothetical protein